MTCAKLGTNGFVLMEKRNTFGNFSARSELTFCSPTSGEGNTIPSPSGGSESDIDPAVTRQRSCQASPPGERSKPSVSSKQTVEKFRSMVREQRTGNLAYVTIISMH